MADETAPADRGGLQGPPSTPVVFVSDVSVEAERIADTLRAAGYHVVHVAISLLAARGVAQRPRLVLVDVDEEGALDELIRLRRAPGTGAIDFVYLGTGYGQIKNADDARAYDGSAFFSRPVDVDALVRRIEALTGGPSARPKTRSSRPPPSIPVRTMLAPTVPPERPSTHSLPAPGARPSLPMSTTSLLDLVNPPRSFASFASVSDELQQLLAEAEARVDSAPQDGPIPSPEEELESVLPADVLASLDDPLDGAESELSPLAPIHETSPGKLVTSSGTRPPTTGGGRVATRSGSDPPRTGSTPLATPISIRNDARTIAQRPSWVPSALETPRDLPVITRGIVLEPDGAPRFFADAVAKRSTGALCFENDGVVRRLVVRDGDLVTAASGAELESLVHFLGARGELPRDEVTKLAEKVPPYGRHAGAALVAHGWLRQDQLWGILRAHSEWIATEVLRQNGGTAQLEPEPPGRLRTEPGVFGASTGAAVFVELVRRATPADEAISRLGGEGSRIGDGPRAPLLAECNLTPHDLDLVSRARGGAVGEVLARAPDGEIAALILALSLLGILEIAPAIGERIAAKPKETENDIAFDEDAIRSRVRARVELVEEGDYFALLGVSRDATGYEVRRAFFELRRAFEPSRILTPRLRDLEGDVRKIIVVLEEAYEILRDAPRRDRYRRAIEARP